MKVVAFANTKGGSVYVGVDDNIGIKGVDADILEAKIPDWIDRHCNPPVHVETRRIMIDDLVVLEIIVAEGNNKPYQHRQNNAFYVRRGPNDYPATRSEIDEMSRM